jgi:uncharacterized protein (UPF0371 family)
MDKKSYLIRASAAIIINAVEKARENDKTLNFIITHTLLGCNKRGEQEMIPNDRGPR